MASSSAKRRPLGDVLDSLLPGSPTSAPATSTPAPAQATPAGKRERLSVDLPADLIDRARNAVFFTPGLSLAALVEDALLLELKRREKERGEPFPRRTAPLRPGRLVGIG